MRENVQDPAQSVSSLQVEQRKFFRFPADSEAMLYLGEAGGMVRCRMLDISLQGCRLRREAELAAPLGSKVEVFFRLSGMAFRFEGVLAWLAKNRSVGVRFEITARQCKELAAVLGGPRKEKGMETRSTEHETQAIGPEASAAEQESGTTEHAMPQEPDSQDSDSAQSAVKNTASPEPVPISKGERRISRRHKVDSYARLTLLSLHTRQRGVIQDVSLSGCRIRVDEPLPVGVYRRVEVEFYIDGLPLLLPGVTQVIHDRYTVGIRFVEMTERKVAQLHTVIDEIEQRLDKEQSGNAPA